MSVFQMLLAGNIGQPASSGPAGRTDGRGVGVGTGLGVDDGLGARAEVGVALGVTVGSAVADGPENAKIRVGCGPVGREVRRDSNLSGQAPTPQSHPIAGGA